MGEEESSPPGDHHRDLPAWGYLLVGVLFTGAGVWLIASGAMADSRRLLVPWFMVAVGLVAVGAGVREWSRNGSATARRRRSAAELEQEARQADRAVPGAGRGSWAPCSSPGSSSVWRCWADGSRGPALQTRSTSAYAAPPASRA